MIVFSAACGFQPRAASDARVDDVVPVDQLATGDAKPIDAPPIPCVDPSVVIGTNVTTGATTDSIPSNILDGFGFVADVTKVAGCAWVYVTAIPTGDIRVGVYSDVASAPANRLATATILHPAALGWSHAALDMPLPVASGTTLWIGLITTAGTLHVPMTSNCASLGLHSNFNAVDLPLTFTTTNTYTDCNGAVYLGP